MTNEELDEARAKEALHRLVNSGQVYCHENIAALGARLARENWTPPEPVDPDLIAVLEFLSKRHPGSNYYHSETAKIDALTQTCLAAYKAGRNQERERAKGLVEYVDRDAHTPHTFTQDRARATLAKYRGEA